MKVNAIHRAAIAAAVVAALGAAAHSDDANGAARMQDEMGHTALLMVLSLAWIIQSVWLADRLDSVVEHLQAPTSR